MTQGDSQPYKALGAKIKHLRQQWQQSIDEVSTTLEIDRKTLREIESGKVVPTDNLLDMLISHFLLTEEQAEDLRSLALLPSEQVGEAMLGGLEDMLMKQIVMYMPVDNRIVYTDSMNATVNKHGVVLQFMQSTGKDSKSIPVSQVGMSREHAERMIEVIKSTLDHHDKSGDKKLLSPPKSKDQ
ncbi:helix-turn-helix transcriptional regulator [Candidatus Saccharibacteria bacterium]|nr:helix-turn-helix transcriptional regulator [Candidatus Saccharibacteria bacterium]